MSKRARPWIRAYFILALSLLSALVNAQIIDANTAVNKAGRQRMLSQRMAKAYIQLGLGVEEKLARSVLDNSVAVFDRQLVELKNYAPTPAIKDTYLQLERAWLGYKDALVGATPNHEHGRRVLALSDEVLALCQQGTAQLAAHFQSTSTHLVNLSGRQRMLSQRLAKLHLAGLWKLANGGSEAEIALARKEFNLALRELMAAPDNTPSLNAELTLLSQQWLFFEGALKKSGSADKNLPSHVATSSERILQLAERIVTLYERLPSR